MVSHVPSKCFPFLQLGRFPDSVSTMHTEEMGPRVLPGVTCPLLWGEGHIILRLHILTLAEGTSSLTVHSVTRLSTAAIQEACSLVLWPSPASRRDHILSLALFIGIT